MTMPHLMNCSHQDEGWCLACVSELHEKFAVAEVACGLWSATFQKYQSWQANGVPAKKWPAAVVKDYEKVAELTSQLVADNGNSTTVESVCDALTDGELMALYKRKDGGVSLQIYAKIKNHSRKLVLERKGDATQIADSVREFVGARTAKTLADCIRQKQNKETT